MQKLLHIAKAKTSNLLCSIVKFLLHMHLASALKEQQD